MKARISATVDPKTLKIIENIMSSGTYRNQSHIIEEAIKLLKIKEEGKGGKK